MDGAAGRDVSAITLSTLGVSTGDGTKRGTSATRGTSTTGSSTRGVSTAGASTRGASTRSVSTTGGPSTTGGIATAGGAAAMTGGRSDATMPDRAASMSALDISLGSALTSAWGA